jgi:hypothetical protein
LSERPPLLPLLDFRGSYTSTDSKLVNGLVEKGQDGNIWVNKRPGFIASYTFGSTGTSSGCYFWQQANLLFYVAGTTLYSAPGGTTIGTVTAGTYDFNETKGTPSYLFLKSSSAAYYYSSSLTTLLTLKQAYNLRTYAEDPSALRAKLSRANARTRTLSTAGAPYMRFLGHS